MTEFFGKTQDISLSNMKRDLLVRDDCKMFEKLRSRCSILSLAGADYRRYDYEIELTDISGNDNVPEAQKSDGST
jgi:hypothetical protein